MTDAVFLTENEKVSLIFALSTEIGSIANSMAMCCRSGGTKDLVLHYADGLVVCAARLQAFARLLDEPPSPQQEPVPEPPPAKKGKKS